MENKTAVFSPGDLDYLVCALIRYQADLRAKTNIMEAHAGPGHAANHRAKLETGERLLEKFNGRAA